MKFVELGLAGVWLIEPELHKDERGILRRHFCQEEFARHGLNPHVAQGNISENPTYGTLRGFHYQVAPFEEAKTISCITGSVHDIVADLRPDSKTFMQWIALTLSAEDRKSLYVPKGCANAWLTTAPNTVLHYYMSDVYVPDSYRGFRYDDPAFGFQWPFEPHLISAKDKALPSFDPGALQRR